MTPDQKAQIAEEQEDQEERSIMLEDAGSVLDIEDVKMSNVFTAELPVNVSGQFSCNLCLNASLRIQER